MADTYSKDSLINIMNDTYVTNSGKVWKDTVFVVNNNSRCTFTYDYSSKPLESSKLKIEYDIESSASSRYNNNIGIVLKITTADPVYDSGAVSYSEGVIQTVNIIPYTSSENKGKYNSEIVDVNAGYIKKLEVIVYFYSDKTDAIILNKLNIYPLYVLTENNVISTVKDTIDNQYGSMYMCIPVVDALPDPSSVPNGVNEPYLYVCAYFGK
nr:MAG TPA: hypothetical protein [Caudoviricetes sp.]